MSLHDDFESRRRRRLWGTKGRVLRVRAPGARGGGEKKNVLALWLEANRSWVREAEVMTWLHREHPQLVEGCVLPEEMGDGPAGEALRLVRARVGEGK